MSKAQDEKVAQIKAQAAREVRAENEINRAVRTLAADSYTIDEIEGAVRRIYDEMTAEPYLPIGLDD